ncbi:MAG TPA: TonB-dependent receptor [Burkholderiales bacterium]|nr:TonB-dependent receptor [Burkholderiales bacterium]
MRIARSTLIGTAVALALFGRNAALHAQTVVQPPSDGALPAQAAGDQASKSSELQEVVVTGIRYASQQSLAQKRAATNDVEVVTAEDIGKMPDKNVADSLKRVPGLTVSPAGANEGGFDENDRVSMRGTGPSLTQTLINGHNVASGDWFVLDQTGTVGRSVSYTLLPSEVVSKVVIEKTSEASLVEGGVAGSVDIITRRPLEDFNKPFTFQVSAGAVYADLPDKTDPQANGLFNYRNDDGTFGVLVQGFLEDRHLRRDGTELLGYEQILPGSPIATANPNLSGVYYPYEMGAALFEQERKRTGGLVDVELKPSDAVELDLSGFYSKLEAGDYNRNYLLWNTHYIAQGQGQAPDPGYVVTNNTLTSATFTGVPGTAYGVYDQIDRPDESADSYFINLDGHFRLSQQLSLLAQVGTSEGHGKTPTQNVAETEPGVGAGAFWSLNGIGSGPNFGLPGVNYTQPFPPGDPQALTFGWIFGAQDLDTIDKETWGKLDATFDVANQGAWQDLKFGARYAKHDRDSTGSIAQGPTFSGPNGGGTSPLNYPTTYSNYPSNYDTFGGQIPTGIWYWSPAQLAAYNGPGLVQRDPVMRAYPPYWFELDEKDTAAYVQADFKGQAWSANVGLRYVHTTEDTINWFPLGCTATIPASAGACPASTPNLVVGSLFGAYEGLPTNDAYNDILPSANLKLDLSPDLVGRFAVGETMTRADYSALAGGFGLLAPGNASGTGGGTGSNPDLAPIRSWNYDAGLEWYFAPRSLLAATLFYMDLKNYIGYGSETLTFPTSGPTSAGFPPNEGLVPVPYLLSIPINTSGRADGIELTYVQSLGNFGIEANYTYTDAVQTSDVPTTGPSAGDDRLVGASKNVYNISGYYENAHFSARVSYNYRSAFYSGLDRSTAFTQDSIGTLAASLAWIVNENFSLTLDGENLNDPILKYYAANEDQPRAFYKNGRQYYLMAHAKF